MKIINLEQGSKEWLSWRKTVITATDAPAILGSSPWVTPYKCWQKKLGLCEEEKANEAMLKGIRLEPVARALFIENYGINMIPVVVESSEYDFLGASLDGISDDKRYILEIKCGGEKLYNMAEQGSIPEYYLDQMQKQLYITKAEQGFYFCYYEGKSVCIAVAPDVAFEAKYLPVARAFWKNVVLVEPPPLKAGDYRNMNNNLDWNEYAKLYQETDAAIKSLEEKKESLRKNLISLCENESCMGQGLKVMKTCMKGRIAYDEIPEIKGLDLDKYRKSPVSSWKILVG